MSPRISVESLLQAFEDPTVDERTLRRYVRISEDRSDAFAPGLELNPVTVDVETTVRGSRGAPALRFLNDMARERRHRRFRRKLARGYQGPIIVSEGDSWFQYPILLDDVIDGLSRRYAIYSHGAAGDTLEDMRRQDDVIDSILDLNAHAFLFSAGGNDLFGDGRLSRYLRPFDARLRPADYLLPEFDRLLDEVLAQYNAVIDRVHQAAPAVQIFCHAYDRAQPMNQRWLGKPMASIGIDDPVVQRDIVAVLFDRFAQGLQARLSERRTIHVVQTAGLVGPRWHDELHPTDEGFAAVSRAFALRIDAAMREVGQAREPGARELGHAAVSPTAAASLETSSTGNVAPRPGTPVGPLPGTGTTSTKEGLATPVSHGIVVGELVAAGSARAGRRGFSVHIGVNRFDAEHYGSDGTLQACEFDADAMADIARSQGYQSIEVLKSIDATREAVVAAIRTAAEEMRSGDACLISYAGHGAQIPDRNAALFAAQDPEEDGQDETWCLYDGQLIDDELWCLWQSFPAGSCITVVTDSCHNESIARRDSALAASPAPSRPPAVARRPDLEVAETTPVEARSRWLSPRLSTRAWQRNRAFYDAIYRQIDAASMVAPVTANVQVLAGCKDTEVAFDGPLNGAFTTGLLEVWNEGAFSGNSAQLIAEVGARLGGRQTPQYTVYGPEIERTTASRPFRL